MFRLICTTVSILATVWSIWPNTFCAQHHVKKLYIGEMIFRFKGKYIKSVADTTNKYMRQVHANCKIKSQLRGYDISSGHGKG